MADEEGEIRRMAEIADAINAILEADAPSEEPVAANENAGTDNATSADETANMNAAVDAAPQDDVLAADDLDAAIAAEFAREGNKGGLPPEDMTQDPFGPTPDLDLSAPNHAVGQNVRADSEMASLSLRMQDTLAEIRMEANQSWAGADELLAEMEAARAAMVNDVRSQIQAIADATQKRREGIMAELSELENQSMLARDEMEIMLVKFEATLGGLQSKYFQSAEVEKERLGRYRDFLQFLLDERGL